MTLQVVLPNESAATAPDALVDLARRAEDLGYDAVWLPDHLLPPHGHDRTYGGVHEPLVTLAHLAAHTSRIRLGTSVLIAPLREPVLLAKQVATLARLSGERFLLGVGAGWERSEFDAVGADFARRGARTDEVVDRVRALLAGENDDGVLEPRPRRPVPIVVGGNTAPALRRAARVADEWQGVGLDADGFDAAVARLRALTDRPIRVGTRLAYTDGEPGPVRDELDRLRERGADSVPIWFGEPEGLADRMARLAPG